MTDLPSSLRISSLYDLKIYTVLIIVLPDYTLTCKWYSNLDFRIIIVQ